MLRPLLPASVVVEETRDLPNPDLLHPDEAQCVESAVEKRRREFAGGRLCARRALARLGIEDFPLLPDTDRVPLWPQGVVGCIAHTTGYVAAAAARSEATAGIGIDVERGDPLSPRVVPRICAAAEILRLSRLPPRSGVDWYKLIFSAKESLYKAYYPLTRTFLGFHDVDIVVEPDHGSFTATLLRQDAPAISGARSFVGRYAFGTEHIFTAVALAAGNPK